MDRTVVALYDEYNDAKKSIDNLVDAGFVKSQISFATQNDDGNYMNEMSRHLSHVENRSLPGIGSAVVGGPLSQELGNGAGGSIKKTLAKWGFPAEMSEQFAEGLRRGSTLLAVDTTHDGVDNVIDILDRNLPVDMGRRSEQWRLAGWQNFDESAEPYTREEVERGRSEIRELDQQETIEVVEEDVQIGKREVESGRVRVHTYLKEVPVEEDVRLRTESVHIERTQVDRPVDSNTLDAFQEGSVELTETAEEVIINKEARVVEEVTIGTQVDERTETVRETARQTVVEVEEVGLVEKNAEKAYSAIQNDYRTHFDTHYGDRNDRFERYEPAYQYGYTLANKTMYREQNWNALEPEARRLWEEKNEGTWEEFKDAVEHGWDRVKQAVS